MEINLTQIVGETVIRNANSPSAAKRLEQMRPQIMNYLSDNCLYIFRQKVAEVYQINSFRKNRKKNGGTTMEILNRNTGTQRLSIESELP